MAQTARNLPTPPRMTYEEFLRWDGENQHVGWVDGEVVEIGPVTRIHQQITGFLLASSEILAGLWINVDWLWQEPLPPLRSVLKEWKLI